MTLSNLQPVRLILNTNPPCNQISQFHFLNPNLNPWNNISVSNGVIWNSSDSSCVSINPMIGPSTILTINRDNCSAIVTATSNNTITTVNITIKLNNTSTIIGGTISGLVGTGLVLQNNGGDDLPISADGAFFFTTAIASGDSYAVTIMTQPTNPVQTCIVTNGSGIASNNTVTNININCTPPTLPILNAAVGYYTDTSTTFPMLTKSIDGGMTWNYAIESGKNLPTSFVDSGSFNSVSCFESLCAAGGSYNNGSVYVPMLAVSTDAGVTWNYAIESGKNLPTSFVDSGGFSSVSCFESLCTAGGAYNNGSVYVPMLAVSTDGGVTWNYAIESGKNLPTGFVNFGVFSSVSCFESLCTAGGAYNGPVYVPMLAVSTDAGVTWNYAIESEGAKLPTSFSADGKIISVSCSASLCAAGGYYNNGSVYVPMLAVSTDAGVTWNYDIESGKNLPTSFVSGVINAVSCSDSLCIVGGSYEDGLITSLMLAVSPDSGATWNYPIETNTNFPTDFNLDGEFYSVSCSGSLCIAGGYYDDGTTEVLMLAVSTDAGVNWNYPIESGKNLPTNFGSYSNFLSTSCSDSLCTAGGLYNDGSIDLPVLAVSTDAGVTWNYAIESGKNLPVDFDSSGAFNAVSSAKNP